MTGRSDESCAEEVSCDVPARAGAVARSNGRSGTDLPQPLLSETALLGADATLRMMARTLELLAALLPVAGAVFYSIDGSHGRQSHGPLLMKLSQFTSDQLLDLDPDQRVREYFSRYHKVDPFDPRLHAHRKAPIVSAAELGGIKHFLRTAWAAEYLASWGVAVETVMFLRENGRITAGISLSRTRDAPEFNAGELLLLHRCQPMIEEAWTLAHRRPTTLEHDDRLQGRGLTPREIEIARLAATGSSIDEIARALIISPHTVHTHLKRGYAKLGVHNRLQLARLLGPDEQRSNSDD